MGHPIGCPPFSLLVAEFPPQNLADVGLGQFVTEFDHLRALVAGQVCAAVVDNILLCESFVLANSEDLDDLTRALIGDSDGRGFQYAVQLDNDIFDFIGIYVEAGHENHVFLAILYPEETIFVHTADVAGFQPATRQHYIGRIFGSLPVAFHYLRALDADFANFAKWQLIAVVANNYHVGRRYRQSDCAVEVAIDRATDRDRRGFRQSVALQDRTPGLLFPFLGHSGLYRHAPTNTNAQRTEVDLVKTGRMHERGEHRVDIREQVEVKARDFLCKALKISWVGDQHVFAALGHYGQAIPFQRKNVVERQRRNRNDRLNASVRIGLPCDGLLHVVNHIAVAEHCALGHAGRAAGVLQVGDVRVSDINRFQFLAGTDFQCLIERRSIGKTVCWHSLLHVPHYEVG